MPTPHTGTALSLSHLYSTRFYSTRFYSLTTSTAIATSISIFTTAELAPSLAAHAEVVEAAELAPRLADAVVVVVEAAELAPMQCHL